MQKPEVTFYKTWALYRRLMQYVFQFWSIVLLGLGANILYSGIDAGFTYMLMPFLNKGFIDKDASFVQWIPLIIIVGISARGIVSSTAGYCMTSVARSVVKVFRQKIFQHILYLPAKYYDNHSSGQLLSKILYDTEQVAQVGADALTTFVQSMCLVIGLLIVMFVISWQLSLFFFTTIPFLAFIIKYTNQKIRRVSHAVQRSMGDVTEIAEEAIEGYKVVRIFSGQQYEIDKFERATNESLKRDLKVAKTKAYNVLGVQCVIACGIAIIILAAIKLSAVIQISAGGFVSMIAAMLQLIRPMRDLATVNSIIQRGLAGAESVFILLDEPLEVDHGKKRLARAQGIIQFNQVSFSYDVEGKKVLKDINLTVQQGQTVALVGRSGSGKTTLANLLPRFYDGYQGKITLDGIDILDLTLANLREQIAVVSQHVTLFNDTIANNIAYGTNFTKSEVTAIEEAARSAHAMEFIAKLPHGLDSLIGENGVLLSGGQRQRIAIARAILKDAPILILDEATSALDTESERHIQLALEAVMKNRTTLVIAHRLSTIERADLIVVLDQGHIVETGSHQELLQKEGYYANLYKLQFHDAAPHELNLLAS